MNHFNTVGSCLGKELVELLPVAQATVSKHLKELTDAGLVNLKQTPPSTINKIDKDNWERAWTMNIVLLHMKD